jgi:DNA-binding transcriptional MerR regulator
VAGNSANGGVSATDASVPGGMVTVGSLTASDRPTDPRELFLARRSWGRIGGVAGDGMGGPEVRLTPAAVARRLGVAVATLRSWDRRHGLGPGVREPGRHRRYTVADVKRLEGVLELVRRGVGVASAAAVVGAGELTALGERGTALRAAAAGLDQGEIERIVGDCLREYGAVEVWQRLLVPFLTGLGDECDVEHVATEAILAAFHAMPRLTGRVLLAAAPDEQHTLPLEALRLALAERGRGSVLLGARVPAPALLAAIGHTEPTDVVVWAHDETTATRLPVPAVLARGCRLIAAGPGWTGIALPAGVPRPATLADAVELVGVLA